ncbi:MAG TPA: amidohydrolase [Vicinamibacteria bacterium]|nr:amidohydrolase [Vicinamibacteria bacterium]
MFPYPHYFSATLFLLAVPSAAQNRPPSGIFADRIARSVESHQVAALDYRHRIHQDPELGNREFETAKLVAEHLRSLSMVVRTGVAHTGVVGVLKGGKDGPVIAVRADMDALPVSEDTDLRFKSTKRGTYNGQEVGIMHACGHDIHTAVQMGVASVLTDLQQDIPGTVLFVFQPAEEGPPEGEEGGANLMLEEGVFDDPRPEAVFGLHTLADLPVGQIGFTEGPALAAVDHFKATVKGTQTHGAQPHQGVDPIVMASQVVLALQTIASRNLDPLQPVVVTVGMFHGGERFNIIPAQVHLEGTVRTYDPDVRNTVERRMGEILDGITRAGGGSYTLDYQRGTPATINDPELTQWMVPSVAAVVGEGGVIDLKPTMGGEDFAYYANEVPGFFYRLGTLKEGTVSGPHHSPTFRADDAAVPIGMRVMTNVLLDYLFRRSQGSRPE